MRPQPPAVRATFELDARPDEHDENRDWLRRVRQHWGLLLLAASCMAIRDFAYFIP